MLTHSSLESTLTIWSEVMARPTWAPTSRTPWICFSSLLACVVIRVISGWEVPGAPFRRISRSVSLNEGARSWLSSGTIARPTSISTRPAAPATSARPGVCTIGASARS
jgi:hypothetical protein